MSAISASASGLAIISTFDHVSGTAFYIHVVSVGATVFFGGAAIRELFVEALIQMKELKGKQAKDER